MDSDLKDTKDIKDSNLDSISDCSSEDGYEEKINAISTQFYKCKTKTDRLSFVHVCEKEAQYIFDNMIGDNIIKAKDDYLRYKVKAGFYKLSKRAINDLIQRFHKCKHKKISRYLDDPISYNAVAKHTTPISFINAILTMAQQRTVSSLCITKLQFRTLLIWLSMYFPKLCYEKLYEITAKLRHRFQFWEGIMKLLPVKNYISVLDLAQQDDSDDESIEGDIDSYSADDNDELITIGLDRIIARTRNRGIYMLLLGGPLLIDDCISLAYKIGHSNDHKGGILGRIKDHCASGSFLDITIVNIIYSEDSCRLERAIKHTLQKCIVHPKNWIIYNKQVKEVYMMHSIDSLFHVTEIATRIADKQKPTELLELQVSETEQYRARLEILKQLLIEHEEKNGISLPDNIRRIIGHSKDEA
jgi:hypothetical protein